MKQVELYAQVRYAVQIEGLSQRAAARRFGIDPRTVGKMMMFSVPPGYVRTKPPVRPRLDPFIAMRALSVGVLGIAVLRLGERLTPGEDADLLAADVLNVTIAGLRAGVALQSPRGVDCPLDAAEPVVDAQAS